MTDACILVVEPEVLIRQPLSQYLRECGYVVVEAVNGTEARKLLGEGKVAVDVLLVDAADPADNAFALAAWVREHHAGVKVILAGGVTRAVEMAGDLCNRGPALARPYEHHLVLEHIRGLLAARDRAQDCRGHGEGRPGGR